MEFFAHPWYMAAGGALISSPILIHLINRMRFKRIRWAAMEFLLKSQKRNRRRLIIEQMILLLLRILLVLLAAFLVARFLYGGVGPRGTHHVVVIDDTLSMTDTPKEGSAGPSQPAYRVAIEQIKELARNAAQAPSAQNMRVSLLSEMDGSPLWEGRLSDQSVQEIDARFAGRLYAPTLTHIDPLAGLKKGQEYLAEVKSDGANKLLHIVSDFRDSDWSGPDAAKLKETVGDVLKAGVNLNFIDVAAPYRGTTGKVALHHDNVALVDLKADTRVAIADVEVEFTATVVNHSQGEATARFEVFINGEQDLSRDYMLEKLKPRETRVHKFTLRFFRKENAATAITEKDSVDERERKRRLEREYFHVRTTLRRTDGGEDSLRADNVRDLMMEVRKRVPTLVVDGNKPENKGDNSDLFILQSFYNDKTDYEPEERTLTTLEKTDLDLYPCIVLLNVAEIPPKLAPKLKSYVEKGGSLCYFLGEEVKAGHYNNELFKAGLFPLQIEDRPYDPLAAAGVVDPEIRKKEREKLYQTAPQPKLLFRDPEKNILAQRATIPGYVSVFRYLSVNVYWKATPKSQWDPDGRKTVAPLVLPNASDIGRYRGRATELARLAYLNAEKIAGREPEMKRFLKPLEAYQRKIRDALGSGELFRLAEELQSLLTNPGVKDDPEKPRMNDLWTHSEMKSLREQIQEFRDSVLYGDPLVVSKSQGKGKVVAVLTPPGPIQRRGVGEDAVAWNNWAEGSVVAFTYPLFLVDLHRFLISEGEAPNRTLGEPIEIQVDASRYEPKVTWTFEGQPDMAGEKANKVEPKKETGLMKKTGNLQTFTLDNVKKPGVARINLTFLGEGPEETRQETRAYAYNINALAESDLKRAANEVLQPDMEKYKDGKSGSFNLRAPGKPYEDFKQKQPDASESPWLYLFFIIILVVEQAMAVHLSYHMKGNESAPPTPLGHNKPATAAA